MLAEDGITLPMSVPCAVLCACGVLVNGRRIGNFTSLVLTAALLVFSLDTEIFL